MSDLEHDLDIPEPCRGNLSLFFVIISFFLQGRKEIMAILLTDDARKRKDENVLRNELTPLVQNLGTEAAIEKTITLRGVNEQIEGCVTAAIPHMQLLKKTSDSTPGRIILTRNDLIQVLQRWDIGRRPDSTN